MGIILELVDFLTEDVDKYLATDENILFSDRANLFQTIAIGGMLTLTNKRLIFFPHKLNLGMGKKEYIDLRDISSLKKVLTLQIVDNGLIVKLTDDRELQFVVTNQDAWIEKINSVKTDAI